jgi:uncharacterized LabA/DUF88 family protein
VGCEKKIGGKGMKKNRVGLFVDGSNIHKALRQANARMDYGKLLDRAKQEGDVVVSSIYCTVNPSNSDQTDFVRALKYLGFSDVNRRFIVWNENGQQVKGLPDTNCDVEMAFDIGLNVGRYRLNTVILATGDHQFADVASKLRAAGIRVLVFGAEGCTSDHLIVESTAFESLRNAGFLVSNGSGNQATANNSDGGVGLVKNGGEVQLRRAA